MVSIVAELPDGMGTCWKERVTSDNEILDGCMPFVGAAPDSPSFPSRTGNGAVKSSAIRSKELTVDLSV